MQDILRLDAELLASEGVDRGWAVSEPQANGEACEWVADSGWFARRSLS
jgi:hypothetical protein